MHVEYKKEKQTVIDGWIEEEERSGDRNKGEGEETETALE